MAVVILLFVFAIQCASGLRLSGVSTEPDNDMSLETFRDWSFENSHWSLPEAQRFRAAIPHDDNFAADIACEKQDYELVGEWPVCKSNPRREKCVVYSFGLGGDMNYESYKAENGCEVHGFDPTIELRGVHEELVDAKTGRNPKVNFHFMGATGENPHPENIQMLEDPWTDGGYGKVDMRVMKPVPEIMKELGHDYIDILKMDCEGCEWGVFADLSPEFLRDKVGDILLETHFRSQTMTPTVPAYKTAFQKILDTRKVQWRHPNGLIKPNSTITQELLEIGLPVDACCIEYAFIKTP